MEEALVAAQRRVGAVAGDLWWIPDELIEFGDFDRSARTRHQMRPCIVMQGDDHAQNASCPTILVVPLSSNTLSQRPWEDSLFVSETPLDNPSIIKVHLVQPVNREDLMQRGRRADAIDHNAFGRIRIHLLWNLGLVRDLPNV